MALMAMFALTVTALGMTATSASAFVLPDVSIALGGASPLHLNFADDSTTLTALEDTSGNKLEGKGVGVLLLLQAALGALGVFELHFLNVIESKTEEKCKTGGDSAGEVLVTGEWHVVPISTTPLVNGIAFLLIHLVVIECGTKKVDVKGCALAEILAKNSEDVESTKGKINGASGKAELTKYINDAGTGVKCELEEEFGNTKIFRQASEKVNGGTEITLTALEGKMYEFSHLL